MLQQLINPEIALPDTLNPQLVIHLSVVTAADYFQLRAYTTETSHCAWSRKDEQISPETTPFHCVDMGREGMRGLTPRFLLKGH